MQLMKIEELKPHPRNSEFFDDMSGEKWQEFLESIRTSGVIEPIVITQDKVIVSGHQRVRACKELGITEIMTEMRSYDSEDKIIKDLLETNVRQRGNIGGSSVKLGRRIRELERIYDIHKGGSNKATKVHNANIDIITQDDLLKQLGLSRTIYHYAKSLTTLPTEIQDLIEQGNISPSTASRLIAKLTPEQQEQLIQSLPITEKLTQKQVQRYIDNMKQSDPIENDNAEIIENLRRDNARMAKEYKSKVEELNNLQEQVKQQAIPEEQFAKKLKDETILFCGRVADFLQKVGGYAWIVEYIRDLPQTEKQSYQSAVENISAWANSILSQLKPKPNIYTVSVDDDEEKDYKMPWEE